MEARPRLLILTRENVLHWSPLYVAAFRELADVITAGPALRRDNLVEQGWEHVPRWLEPNDLLADTDDLLEVLRLLPEGWRPDFVVAIQSSGPVYRNIDRAACPTAYISVDTWHDPNELKYARPYDHVFCAQRSMVEYFRAGGLPRVEWLPLACSVHHHRPVEQPPVHDFVFTGMTMFRVNRQRMARIFRLQKAFDVGVYGGLGGEDYCRALSGGRAVFNSSVAQDVNMRVFEAMAVGRPLLTNRDAAANGLTDLFAEGEHFLGYDDQDLVGQARRLMDDVALRERLAAAAREHVLQSHTYTHRARVVLERLEASGGECVPGSVLREGAALSAWLPRGARVVMDVGMRLDRSRVALRHAGVERVIGVALGGDDARARRYDEAMAWPPAKELERVPDAVLAAHVTESGLSLQHLIEYARDTLPPGGEVVIFLRPDAAEQIGLGSEVQRWDSWLYHHGFHLVTFAVEDDTLIVRGRHYTQDLLAISTEIYGRFPGGDTGPLEEEHN